MKLFFKQQLPYSLMILFMAAIMMSVYWLDGYRDVGLLFYGLGIALFFLVVFLIGAYFSQRNLYQVLTEKKEIKVFQEIEKDGSPISQAMFEVLRRQYQYYYAEIKQVTNAREEHNKFINQWVHQMKTPLSVIELMVQEDAIDHESLIEESDRLKEGLNLALNLSRLESFQQDFVVEKVFLREVALRAVEDHKRNFIRNYVYPKIEIPEDLTVETDEKWLHFILFQLLSNAIKYSSGNGKQIKIVTRRLGFEIQLQVIDQGIGIKKSDLPRVFQAFYTGSTGRIFHEATGMGLYLVHEICLQLTHQIIIESEIDRGTTVTVTF